MTAPSKYADYLALPDGASPDAVRGLLSGHARDADAPAIVPWVDTEPARPLRLMLEPRPTRLETVSVADLLAELEPDCEWLVDGWYPMPGVVVQAGDPKSFKTLLGLQLAVVVASADVDTFMGRPVRHGPVLFIEEEGSRRKLRERIEKMREGLGSAAAPDLTFVLFQGLRLDDESSVADLDRLVAERRPILMVLDPLVLLHRGEENSNSEMARVMRPLIGLAAKYDCTVLLIHHTSKPQAERRTTRLAQRLRGAGAFAGATDANIVMDRDGDYGARIRGEFRDAEPLDLYVELDVATLLLRPALAPLPLRKVGVSDLVAWVREVGRVNVSNAMKRFEVSRNTARSVLQETAAAGLIDTARDGSTDWYFPMEVRQ
jgi:hypothetical protein